ncbi:MAG: methyltransferase domain-containing protein [Vescimonas sp.]
MSGHPNSDFPNDTFDLVISRNVVWTIMDAEKAFREWRRVLKPGWPDDCL